MAVDPMNDDCLFADEKLVRGLVRHLGHGDSFMVKEIARHNVLDTTQMVRWSLPGSHGSFAAFQFWDKCEVPLDVMESIKKNKARLPNVGSTHKLFDLDFAHSFVNSQFGGRIRQAFSACRHPAMQSDFFRLTYLYLNGGLYIDADMEVTSGFNDVTFEEDNCIYLSVGLRTKSPNPDGSWTWFTLDDLLLERMDQDAVCYFQNDVVACTPFNEVIRQSLVRAVLLIEDAANTGEKLRAHTVTGPTNLTVAALIHVFESALFRRATTKFRVFDRAKTVKGGTYEYKKDERNWQIAEA